MDAPNTPRTTGQRFGTIRRRWLLAAAGACLSFSGCAMTMDDLTSREFTHHPFQSLFAKPDEPMWVINNSQDGDKRARAFKSLREPAQTGGSDQDQEAVVTVLVYAAANDRQALCRTAAICALRDFKDPRAVEGLKEAYYRASSFAPDSATILRCQALAALGHTRNPAAIDLLVKVLREPAVEGAEVDRQQGMDVRIAAARALGNFRTKESSEALVAALKSDQDALHVPAHESLVAATGRRLPADAQLWDDFVNNRTGRDGSAIAGEQSLGDRLLEILPVNFWR